MEKIKRKWTFLGIEVGSWETWMAYWMFSYGPWNIQRIPYWYSLWRMWFEISSSW